jgi:uncharacterized protein
VRGEEERVITEDQREVIAFLADPRTHGGAPVERVDTHASLVFLAGTRALKLKRAVRYDYLDFSTRDRRRAMCEAEVRANRRTAPALYRGVAAVTRGPDGALALDGTGPPVDWVVEMNRFDQDGLFDRLASRGQLDEALMSSLAVQIAHFHDAAARRTDHGGRAGLTWVIDGNATEFVEEGRGIFDCTDVERLTAAARSAVNRQGDRLEARRKAGFVRECHGDLHLRNIVLLDGRPTLFDAIEFNDEIACTDVLYDLAFLLMDLWRRQLPAHANRVYSDYLAETGDFDGVPLLPLFLSCRAAVRAKTSAAAARLQADAAQRADLERLARSYLASAIDLLQPPRPCIVAIGGFSGSGKTTLARALAPLLGPVPGAVIVRSDDIRKRLFGVAPSARLGPEGYTEEVTRRVYAGMLERARVIVGHGHAVVLDAVFARPADREAVAAMADAMAIPLTGIWLDAPEPVLAERARQRRGDASDADPGVVRVQVEQGSGPLTWPRVRASGDLADVLRQARALVPPA